MRVLNPCLVTRALALLVVSSSLTTCGDDGSSSKEDRGVFGEMADVLMQAESDYLTANAEIFASAEYMEPFIAELLNLSTPNGMQSTVQTSCLPEGMGGRTYTINGTPFTSVPDSAVPEYTARFRLFRLSTANQPLLDQEIGYVDYTCVSVGVTLTEVQMFSDTILVSSATYSAQSENFAWTIRTPDALQSAILLGRRDGGGTFAIEAHDLGGFQITYGSQLGDAWSAETAMTIEDSTWRLTTELKAEGSSGIVSGGATYQYSASQLYIVACVEAGTIDSPVFSNPAPGCSPFGIPRPVTPAELQAMSDSYLSLRHFWVTAANLVEICRSLVPNDN